MAEYNEAYVKHSISKFLREHAVNQGEQHSLTGMGSQKGCWFIPDEKYPQFLDYLYDYLKDNSPLGLVEQHDRDKAYPLLIDLDFKYKGGKRLIRSFHNGNILSFIKQYSQGLLKFYSSFPTGTRIRFFVTLRKIPYRSTRKVNGEPIEELKDGIHIESPDIVMTADRQRVLRRFVLDNDILGKSFENTSYINSPEDVFDESLVKRNGWLIYGDTKPTLDPYRLEKVYVLDTESGEVDEQEVSYSERELMELLSIRYNLATAITEENENQDAKNDSIRLQLACAGPKTPVYAPRNGAAPSEILDLEPIVANYLYPPQTERDIAVVRRLVLECLSEERADKYSTWRETEWCLRNINDSKEMFDLWIEFSKKSSKSSKLNVEREYRDWRRGAAMPNSGKQLTKRSLHYWARQDNIEKYNQIIKADIVEWVSQGRCKNTHNHVAQMLNLMYDNDYRVAMDSKRIVWYRYRKNMWQQAIQGVDLRNKLSNEVADLISEGRKERKQWLLQQGTEDTGNDLIVKELLTIEKNLYSCGFKDSTMKEAASIFYEEDFEKKLNANTSLFGCANCTLNLRAERIGANGKPEMYVQIRDPKTEDYISFMAGNNPPDMEPLEYHPYSNTDKANLDSNKQYAPDTVYEDPYLKDILDFFVKIFPRADLREYVLTLIASCLEGANREQAYYIMTGVGSNGKSKLTELTHYTLGDYLSSLSTTAITRKRPDSGAANPDIIKIKNKRMIIMQEPDPNEPLNTSRMKQFSGEDDVEARGLFQDQDTFKITGKLFMSCNKLPPIHTMDNGTWRRIRVLPFEARFVDPGDTTYDPSKNVFYKDYELDAKLKLWRKSFLSLLVHYYETRYLRTGLNPPPVVMQVSNNYKYSHDSFAKFYESCVRKDPEAPDVTFTKVFKTYSTWYSNLSGSSGMKLKAEEFKNRLEEKLNTTITKHVRGIQLFASEEEAEEHDKESVTSE